MGCGFVDAPCGKRAVVAIIGFGNIGSGVAQVLEHGRSAIARAGVDVELRYILDTRDFSSHPLSERFVNSIDTIIGDPEVNTVVEAIGGLSPAFEYDLACLEAGKSVVTSNKELVAARGAQLLEAAANNGARFMFEASVGGAAPIIATLRTSLAANRIERIFAILNGTTNFILTRMRREGESFEQALKTAQNLGYAETRDPSDDIDGLDPMRKIAILASIASGSEIPLDKIPVNGIGQLTEGELRAAESLGGTIKLIARAERSEKGFYVGVEPMFVPFDNPLSAVEDVMNQVAVECDFAGPILVGGRGAGKLPTAGAMVADIIEALHCPVCEIPLWQPAEPGFTMPEAGPARYMLVLGDSGAALSDRLDTPPEGKCYRVLES